MRTLRLVTACALILPALALTQPASAQQTRAPAAPTTAIKVESVAKNLVHPWGLQFLPDGRMLVTERPGRLRIVTRDGTLSSPIAGVPKVHAVRQGGLLDVALTPDFATSQEILLTFAEPREDGLNGTSVASGRLELTAGGGRLTNVRVIFRQQPSIASDMHFGSRIVFVPDGSFFLTVGERYTQKQEAQDPANHLGKVMRLNRDGTPFAGNPNKPGWDPAVWSIGHRNIQAAALHPETGELWIVDHGARGGDEVNVVRKGLNYGWPVITYGRDYSGAPIGEGTAKAGMEQPLYYWDPSIAPSGAAFYTGDLFPTWRGNLLVGALAGRHLSRLVLDGEKVVAEERLLVDLGARLRDVRMGPDGAVWILTDHADGQLLRLVPG
ncbi:MAG: PQQ-dependent sugar dehydrogenase [Hyphomicrobium sp.]|nr:PQQ-dependent sugar dehydrogenase [Hyphomicrobium sp.]